MDTRHQKLAELLVRHSCQVKPGEHLLLELFDAPESMAVAMVEATRKAGGHPHVTIRSNRVMRALNKDSGEEGLRIWGECDLERMKRMQCYVGIRGAANVSEMSGIAAEQTVGFLLQAGFGTVGDHADGSDGHHRQHQSHHHQTDFTRRQIALGLPPGQLQNVHATRRPAFRRSWR